MVDDIVTSCSGRATGLPEGEPPPEPPEEPVEPPLEVDPGPRPHRFEVREFEGYDGVDEDIVVVDDEAHDLETSAQIIQVGCRSAEFPILLRERDL